MSQGYNAQFLIPDYRFTPPFWTRPSGVNGRVYGASPYVNGLGTASYVMVAGQSVLTFTTPSDVVMMSCVANCGHLALMMSHHLATAHVQVGRPQTQQS